MFEIHDGRNSLWKRMELEGESMGYGVSQTFSHSFSKYLLSTYYKSNTVQASKWIVEKKRRSLSPWLWSKQSHSEPMIAFFQQMQKKKYYKRKKLKCFEFLVFWLWKSTLSLWSSVLLSIKWILKYLLNYVWIKFNEMGKVSNISTLDHLHS